MEGARGSLVLYDPYEDLFQRPGSEAFVRLFNAEEYFMVPPSYFNDEVKKALRRNAVEIIESHSSTSSDFDALIPYTAMTYFDRFLSRFNRFPTVTETYGGRNEQLFAICCLTIAWKLRKKSFVLSKFLRKRGVPYSTRDVLKMELQICRGLEWRMRTLTPFRFVEFFIPALRLPPNPPSPRPPVRDLIVRSQCDIAFTEFRPSVMATTAMLIVSSKMFPNQHSVFELRITTDVEPLRLLKDMILKCKQQLTPLYRNPPIRKPKDIAIQIDGPTAGPAPGSLPKARPSRGEPVRSKPIYIPGHEPPPSPPKPRLMSKALFLACLPPGADIEKEMKEWERLKEEAATSETEAARGKEPATSESETQHRPGKEPATTKIQEVGSLFADQVGDELMDFELGWKELLEIAERRDGSGRAWFTVRAYIVQGLTNCWINFATTYETVKNTSGGYCNIL